MIKPRNILQILISILLVFLLVGCATLQAKWEKATEEERSRIILSQAQKSLNTLFQSGVSFAATNESFKKEWKEKILPSIKAANIILGDLIARGKAGEKLTVIQVMSAVGNRITEITNLMKAWGIKVSEVEQTMRFWALFDSGTKGVG